MSTTRNAPEVASRDTGIIDRAAGAFAGLDSFVKLLLRIGIGFPFISGRGRLVVKDCIQMGGAFVLLADSARVYLARKAH